MALDYRSVVVKTTVGEVIEVSMTLQDYSKLKVDQNDQFSGSGRYEMIELSVAQNGQLQIFMQKLLDVKTPLPQPVQSAFAGPGNKEMKPLNSPFPRAPVKTKSHKTGLPSELPVVCQFGGTDEYCGRAPKKNQIFCGHHLRKAAQKHLERKKLKRSRSSTSVSWEDDEPNYDLLQYDPNSPAKQMLPVFDIQIPIEWGDAPISHQGFTDLLC